MYPKQKRLLRSFITLAMLCPSALQGKAAIDKSGAMGSSDRFVQAKFLGVQNPAPSVPYLRADLKGGELLEDRIDGLPLMIATQKFSQGLAMRSPGEVVIEMPSGIRSFEAVVGVDSNEIDYHGNAGRGSVRGSIDLHGEQRYLSPVLHEGMPGIPVKVDLDGARTLSLKLTAVGERTPAYEAQWDQVDWGNARVNLLDGSQVWLSDLAVGPPAQTYSLEPPFSFVYGGRPSAELLKQWPVQRSTRHLDERRTEYTSVYTDPATHLEVRCVAVAYGDFPTSEWTVYFKNGGSQRTPILENIQALDTRFDGSTQGAFLLHHSAGSDDVGTDFQPKETPLPTNTQEHFAAFRGRPTDGDEMPYFNLAWARQGVIFALGWPGQWGLDVSRDASSSVHVAGGQEVTHFWLAPGEEVRTPLAVVQFWNGDWIDGQNVWRRWMVAHNLPRPGGTLVAPLLSGGSNTYTNTMMEGTEQNQLEYLKRNLDAGIPIQNWWIDAGWYPFHGTWGDTGTWIPDPARFPRGFRPISDYAHAHGVKLTIWFEPERVSGGTWLAEHHPEWLIGSPANDRLLFLGDPDARQWLIDHISELIESQGIDIYRQDANFQPLAFWRAHDTPDREGITEIEHVEGSLAFFDALHKRFPNLMFDTCASGGRRLDLETLRRAVPLWRSDFPYVPAAMQMQTYGLSLWTPYFGTAIGSVDPYDSRSQMTPAPGVSITPKEIEDNRVALKSLIAQWRQVAPYYYGDFFPLTPYSISEATWMGWQLNQTDGRAGTVQAFRRRNSPFVTSRFKLRGLKGEARYQVRDLDSSGTSEFTGRQLMEQGLSVSIPEQPGAKLLVYKEE
jgi:alpha-galactosidase